jgi:hypothetical protein
LPRINVPISIGLLLLLFDHASWSNFALARKTKFHLREAKEVTVCTSTRLPFGEKALL